MRKIEISKSVMDALNQIEYSDIEEWGGVLASDGRNKISHIAKSRFQHTNRGVYSASNEDMGKLMEEHPNTEFIGYFRTSYNNDDRLNGADKANAEALLAYLPPHRNELYYLLWIFDENGKRPKPCVYGIQKISGISQIERLEVTIEND